MTCAGDRHAAGRLAQHFLEGRNIRRRETIGVHIGNIVGDDPLPDRCPLCLLGRQFEEVYAVHRTSFFRCDQHAGLVLREACELATFG